MVRRTWIAAHSLLTRADVSTTDGAGQPRSALLRAGDSTDPRRGPHPTDAGVTLIEVVVATVLLGILSTAVIGILLSTQSSTVDARNRVAAANLAAREIDLVREEFMRSDAGPLEVAQAGIQTNAHPLSALNAPGDPLVVDGTPYDVVRSVQWNITGAGETACEGGSAVDHPTLSVHVSVTWPGMTSTRPVTNTAQLAPPRGTGLPSEASFVAVKVTDSKGAPQPHRTVVVTSSSSTAAAQTDATGCAVIAVSPSPSGTDYTAHFPDVGYVDITGTTSPTRSIGILQPGELKANVDIALDRAASVTVRLTGAGLTHADVLGSQVTLYQSEYAGTALTVHPVAGLDTVIGNLWPTQYGGFFGTVLPPGLPMVDVGPGESVVLPVPFTFAEFVVEDQPVPSTLIAAPAGTPNACTAPNRRVLDPGAAALPAGVWDLHVHDPRFGCSPGPATVDLESGTNDGITWAPSSLRVVGAPTGQGAIWAVSSAAGAQCAVPATPSHAVMLAADGGNLPAVSLPAGQWHVFAMAASGGVPAGGACVPAELVTVDYADARTYTWPAQTASVRVTGVGSSNNRTVFASRTPVGTCSRTNVPGATDRTDFTRSGSGSNTLYSHASIGTGTWYVYLWNTSGSGGGNRCSGGHVLNVGWAPSYTMAWATGNVTTP